MMLRIKVVLLGVLSVLLATCSARSRNVVVPSTVDGTMTPLVITEAAPLSEEDAGFVTQEPLIAEEIENGSRGLVDSAKIVPQLESAEVVNEATAVAQAERAVQQQLVLSEMVNLIRNNYVDPDLNEVDWQAVLEASQNRSEQQTDTEFWASMAQTLSLLNDADAFFMTPPEVQAYEQMIRGNAGEAGVGVVLAPHPASDDALVAWAIEGNGAYEAGIRSRDRLLAVDGEPICCSANGSLLRSLAGAPGSTVALTVQTGDQPPRSVTVTRQPLVLNKPVTTATIGEIGVMTIHSFVVESVDAAVQAAWEALNAERPPERPLRGLVIDIRPNTGGFEQEMSDTLALFVDGQVGRFQSRNGSAPLIIPGLDVADSQSIPLVVLIGEATSGQAEIFAAVLRAQGRATLIGGATRGNITSIFPHDLSDGSRIWLPEDRFELIDGSSWGSEGLQPDTPIAQPWSTIVDQSDDQALAAALVVLRSR